MEKRTWSGPAATRSTSTTATPPSWKSTTLSSAPAKKTDATAAHSSPRRSCPLFWSASALYSSTTNKSEQKIGKISLKLFQDLKWSRVGRISQNIICIISKNYGKKQVNIPRFFFHNNQQHWHDNLFLFKWQTAAVTVRTIYYSHSKPYLSSSWSYQKTKGTLLSQTFWDLSDLLMKILSKLKDKKVTLILILEKPLWSREFL